jgi:hypothetical protein
MRVNAGVITNFYLGNMVSNDNEEVATLNLKPGDESPYKEISLSGLAGVTVGYRLVDRMDLTLEPNYFTTFESITKSSSNFSTAPSGFGLTAGIRYNFN